MANEATLKQLSEETRTKLRSTQILTSLPTIISELLQNSIDAGASQIDIGVDCREWSCWVMDDGSGFTKDGLRKIGQDSEHGCYNSSKAYTLASLESVTTFGFRGEALASMADLCCLEISSRTARSRESWSVIVKAGKSLYLGPSIRWRRESPGTVVSIRDAFFSLPVRRQSHPTPNKTLELIRQELEAYALVFPNVSFSFQDSSKAKEGSHLRKSHILKIPKTRSTLAAFRHLYGWAFTEEMRGGNCRCFWRAPNRGFYITGRSIYKGEEPFHSMIEGGPLSDGFSSVGQSYQFLYINRHPISYCDLHRLIDNRFAASTFAKHAYDEGGEMSLRPATRRSPRKGEKKPIYVLNLIIPVKHIDNCLEPAKSAVELDNKNTVTSFLSGIIQSFLVRHNFAPDKRKNEDAEDGSPRKKRKLVQESPSKITVPPASRQSERSGTPCLFTNTKSDRANVPGSDVQKMAWEDPLTGETFIVDKRTGNSYPQNARCTVGADGPIPASPKRRTLQMAQLTPEENAHNYKSTGEDPVPAWLQEALLANDAFALDEPKIPSFPLSANQESEHRGCLEPRGCHTGFSTKRVNSTRWFQLSSNFATLQIRFQREDLQKAQIISQVDCKFIACLVGPDRDQSDALQDNVPCEDNLPAGGKTLILIDQHAADERVRVERFLKTICRGFLSHQDGSGGVETKELSPPVLILLTRREASRLAEVLSYQQAFESWGFRFAGLQEAQASPDPETEPDGGYTQVSVCAIPEVVSEKLLLGDELQELVKGYIGALEGQELEVCDLSSQQTVVSSTDPLETQWVKALRWCPRGLLDLINSKACRGAIMFNDPLNVEQCERLVKQLSTTVFPFQCAHGRPSVVPLTRLNPQSAGRKDGGIKWDRLASL